MPELPEVETIARKLKPDLIGRTILSADLRWPRTLAFPSPRKFKAQIQGQKILDVGRRAKFLIIRLSDLHLLIHLRMSGDLSIRDSTIRPETHDRLIIKLTKNKSLVFNDTRKFGRVWLTADPEEVLGKLGLSLWMPTLHPNGCIPPCTVNIASSSHYCSTRLSWRDWATSTLTRPCICPGFIR